MIICSITLFTNSRNKIQLIGLRSLMLPEGSMTKTKSSTFKQEGIGAFGWPLLLVEIFWFVEELSCTKLMDEDCTGSSNRRRRYICRARRLGRKVFNVTTLFIFITPLFSTMREVHSPSNETYCEIVCLIPADFKLFVDEKWSKNENDYSSVTTVCWRAWMEIACSCKWKTWVIDAE